MNRSTCLPRLAYWVTAASILMGLMAPATKVVFAQRGSGQAAAAAKQQIEDAARKGDLMGAAADSARDQLERAGMSPKEIDDFMKSVKPLQDKAEANAKAQRDKQEKEDQARKDAEKKNQNASGTADWNLGQIYRGPTYKLDFPLTNDCRIGQTVTITYPTNIPITGPATVDVPAKTTIQVPLELKVPELNIPPGPLPIGTNFACMDLKDQLKMVHPELTKVETTPKGKSTYVCHAMERTYSVYAHVHVLPPEPPGGGGGGGGGPKKKKARSTCEAYWSTGEFRPDKEHLTPDRCKLELERLAFDMVTEEIPPIQRRDPGRFEWLPKGFDPSKVKKPEEIKEEIGHLTSKELMQLRTLADQAARNAKKP